MDDNIIMIPFTLDEIKLIYDVLDIYQSATNNTNTYLLAMESKLISYYDELYAEL